MAPEILYTVYENNGRKSIALGIDFPMNTPYGVARRAGHDYGA